MHRNRKGQFNLDKVPINDPAAPDTRDAVLAASARLQFKAMAPDAARICTTAAAATGRRFVPIRPGRASMTICLRSIAGWAKPPSLSGLPRARLIETMARI